jgi:hypothetical protein
MRMLTGVTGSGYSSVVRSVNTAHGFQKRTSNYRYAEPLSAFQECLWYRELLVGYNTASNDEMFCEQTKERMYLKDAVVAFPWGIEENHDNFKRIRHWDKTEHGTCRSNRKPTSQLQRSIRKRNWKC